MTDHAYDVANDDEIDSAQIRAARALLDWSRAEAADRMGVGLNTLARLEAGERRPGPRAMRGIVLAFQDAGIVFVRSDLGNGVVSRS